MSLIFGPIPSRRLGRSLGINNIPPKVCSYSCVYCQIGATDSISLVRKEFFHPYAICEEVSARISQLQKAGEKIDYITFVPDGEPTLDIKLGETIERLKSFGVRIAVITNSSLMWDNAVRNDLRKADWVSVKIDSVYENIWKRINRPHGSLNLNKIIDGIEEFASHFRGTLVTETFLVKGINDNIESLNATAQTISRFNPQKSYILVATRPPAEKSVKVPCEESLNTAYQIFNSLVNNAEFLVYSEGTDFTYSSDAEKELLSILAVHPMRKDAVNEFLSRAQTSWNLVDKLEEKKLIKEVFYAGKTFLIKNIGR